jgi:hypothetical protein
MFVSQICIVKFQKMGLPQGGLGWIVVEVTSHREVSAKIINGIVSAELSKYLLIL